MRPKMCFIDAQTSEVAKGQGYDEQAAGYSDTNYFHVTDVSGVG